MEEETSDHEPVEDEVLRKKNFDRGMGVDLDRFLITDPEPEIEEEQEQTAPEDTDAAIGEIADFFSTPDTQRDEPGAIKRDGTVDAPAAEDSVTDLAVHGERRIGFGLLIGMVLVWSVLGWVVGTALPPLLGGPLLIIMGPVSYTHLTLPTKA